MDGKWIATESKRRTKRNNKGLIFLIVKMRSAWHVRLKLDLFFSDLLIYNMLIVAVCQIIQKKNFSDDMWIFL
jgi:hypothetical protein